MTDKTKTWFNYVPLSAAGIEIKDDGSRVFCAIPIERGNNAPPLELAIIGDEEKLELVRVKTPETDGNLDEEDRRVVGSMTEHAISTLQLLFGHDIDRLYLAGRPMAFGQFGNDHGLPQFEIHAQQFHAPPKYDAEVIRNAIIATAPIRVQLTLFVEATRPTTPLPFKYLCYYKILELELRTKRKWAGLKEHLSRYEDDYKKLAIGRASLINLLHSYRDKCAHIKIGGNDDLGLVGMGSKDAERVSKFLPLLNKIVVDLLNAKHSNIIVLQPQGEPAWTSATSDIPTPQATPSPLTR